MAAVDVLIPTCDRPAALAVTLTSLVGQRYTDFRVVVSDQSEHGDAVESAEVKAALRLLAARGHGVDVHKHLPRQGMAEQRQFLLECSDAPLSLFIDDDLILEPLVIGRMVRAIEQEQCGFVGCAVIGLSYVNDVRPHEQAIELWEGPVVPEQIVPGSASWQRYRLHNAANVYHVQRRLGVSDEDIVRYRVAWVGGCVMYDATKLRAAGAFQFWSSLPTEHCGEDVLAQLKVMARFGGCGLLPSGVYHQELPTTVEDRRVNAPIALLDDLKAWFGEVSWGADTSPGAMPVPH